MDDDDDTVGNRPLSMATNEEIGMATAQSLHRLLKGRRNESFVLVMVEGSTVRTMTEITDPDLVAAILKAARKSARSDGG